MSEKIKWDPIKERHRKGTVSRGTVWIRYGKESQPESIYLIMDGETEKHTVDAFLDVSEKDDENAMVIAQILFENLLKAEEIINKSKNVRKKKN